MVKPVDLMTIREKLEKALMFLQRASSVLLVARHQDEITGADYFKLNQDIINLEESIKRLLGDE